MLYSPELRLNGLGAACQAMKRTNHKFPCPVCTKPLEVRLTKKDKPYVTCDPCGVQLFIRGPVGIQEFERLVERGNRDGLLERMDEMQRRYRLTCQECRSRFWIEAALVKTSMFDGSLKGFRCPNCDEVVPWEQKR